MSIFDSTGRIVGESGEIEQGDNWLNGVREAYAIQDKLNDIFHELPMPLQRAMVVAKYRTGCILTLWVYVLLSIHLDNGEGGPYGSLDTDLENCLSGLQQHMEGLAKRAYPIHGDDVEPWRDSGGYSQYINDRMNALLNQESA